MYVAMVEVAVVDADVVKTLTVAATASKHLLEPMSLVPTILEVMAYVIIDALVAFGTNSSSSGSICNWIFVQMMVSPSKVRSTGRGDA